MNSIWQLHSLLLNKLPQRSTDILWLDKSSTEIDSAQSEELHDQWLEKKGDITSCLNKTVQICFLSQQAEFQPSK